MCSRECEATQISEGGSLKNAPLPMAASSSIKWKRSLWWRTTEPENTTVNLQTQRWCNTLPLRDLGGCKSHRVSNSTRSSFKDQVHVKGVQWRTVYFNSKPQVWNLKVDKGTNCVDIQWNIWGQVLTEIFLTASITLFDQTLQNCFPHSGNREQTFNATYCILIGNCSII